jgi:hypothetical protein
MTTDTEPIYDVADSPGLDGEIHPVSWTLRVRAGPKRQRSSRKDLSDPNLILSTFPTFYVLYNFTSYIGDL